MTKTIETLESEIERVVRNHLAAQQAAVSVAVARAFASATSKPPRAATAKRRSPRHRRASAEVSALAERLYEAVVAHPGETIAVIGPHVGESARALNLPMTQLKAAARVRSVGERRMTRYFPMSS